MMLPLGPLPATAGASSTASFSAPADRQTLEHILLEAARDRDRRRDLSGLSGNGHRFGHRRQRQRRVERCSFPPSSPARSVASPSRIACSSNVTSYSPAGRNGMM